MLSKETISVESICKQKVATTVDVISAVVAFSSHSFHSDKQFHRLGETMKPDIVLRTPL